MKFSAYKSELEADATYRCSEVAKQQKLQATHSEQEKGQCLKIPASYIRLTGLSDSDAIIFGTLKASKHCCNAEEQKAMEGQQVREKRGSITRSKYEKNLPNQLNHLPTERKLTCNYKAYDLIKASWLFDQLS